MNAYDLTVRFRPLPTWPHAATPEHARRSRSTFKVSLHGSLTLLRDEIWRLDGGNILIGAGLQDRDIRNDGWPRSDARVPTHPGIEISFDSKYGRLTYATDTCQWWEHNVRSIALGLEALRAVDRYGVSTRGQQYAGWKALPAASGVIIESSDAAWELLYAAAGADASDDEWELIELYRAAAKRTHPDQGGDEEAFLRVRAAYELLKVAA